MRKDDIIAQLPSSYPTDKEVLVLGPDGLHGLNTLKSQIEEMNRRDRWIRTEFRNEPSDAKVSSKVGIVLTMVSIKPGSLASIRKAASHQNICCPGFSLTISETRDALEHLQALRGQEAVVVKNGDAENSKHEIVAGSAESLNNTAPAVIDEVDSALKVIENFSTAVADSQYAILTITEHYKTVKAQADLLLIQLAEKDAELSAANQQLASCQTENVRLKSEIERLQKTWSSLDELVRAAKGK